MPAPTKYPDELREGGVRLVFGPPDRPGGARLEVHREALRHWVREAEADSGRRRDRLTTPGARAAQEARAREPPAPPRERDPEGGERLFRAGARPDPAESMSFIDEPRSRFGVEPISRTQAWLEIPNSGAVIPAEEATALTEPVPPPGNAEDR